MTEREPLHPLLDRIQRPALLIGGGGILLCLIGLLINTINLMLILLEGSYIYFIRTGG